MTKLWKYPLHGLGAQRVALHKDAVILKVEEHEGEVCLVVMVDQTQPMEHRTIEWVAVGTVKPSGMRTLLGTVTRGGVEWMIYSNP